jgi:RND family efflux transporter MFP subunit
VTHLRRRKWLYLGILSVVAAVAAVALTMRVRPTTKDLQPEASDPKQANTDKLDTAVPRVEVIKPRPGGLAQTVTQPGSAQSFESAELFAKVTGYLEAQHVDIGSRVKRGEVLAEIDVPELTKDVESAAASLERARAEVTQAQAQIDNAVADQKAAEAKVAQAKADVDRWEAEIAFSQSQYQRINELFEMKAMPERVVDEKVRQLQASQASHRAAQSAVLAAEQQVVAATSRIELARADLKVRQAKVGEAEAQLDRAKVMASYMKITSPYDGVVTLRSFHRGAFVRAANQGGQVPLLAVDRTDKMRIVVQVPETQVPYVQAGEPATVHFSAFPQRAFVGKVARTADSEHPESRTMRAEIDLPNEDGAIRDRMYGTVEISLPKSTQGVTLPSVCLLGDVINGKAKLFVLREDDRVDLREVLVGMDNGIDVEVLSGVNADDRVVLDPPSDLDDEMKVTSFVAKPKPAGGAHPSH